jgi:hypothetical protein
MHPTSQQPTPCVPLSEHEPLLRDRWAQLDALRTGDGRPLPERLKAELRREIEVIAPTPFTCRSRCSDPSGKWSAR